MTVPSTEAGTAAPRLGTSHRSNAFLFCCIYSSFVTSIISWVCRKEGAKVSPLWASHRKDRWLPCWLTFRDNRNLFRSHGPEFKSQPLHFLTARP